MKARLVLRPSMKSRTSAGSGGEVGTVYPYGKGRGYEMKLQLGRAALACMDAIWEVSPEARFVHVEPLINVAIPRDRPDLGESAKQIN